MIDGPPDRLLECVCSTTYPEKVRYSSSSECIGRISDVDSQLICSYSTEACINLELSMQNRMLLANTPWPPSRARLGASLLQADLNRCSEPGRRVVLPNRQNELRMAISNKKIARMANRKQEGHQNEVNLLIYGGRIEDGSRSEDTASIPPSCTAEGGEVQKDFALSNPRCRQRSLPTDADDLLPSGCSCPGSPHPSIRAPHGSLPDRVPHFLQLY